MSRTRVLTDFVRLLKEERKYWLIPITIVFLLFALLILASQSSVVAPFIYTLF